MRLGFSTMGLVLGLLLVLGADAPAQEAWPTSWNDAVKQSERTRKPILINFTGSDWCGWCKRLKAEVFDTPEFQSWAKKNVVLLEVDFPRGKAQPDALKKQNQELSEKYAVEGYPTILFVNAKGDVLGNYGYDEGGPGAWTKKAETILKKR